MQELRINTNVRPGDATAIVLCNCGALIIFNALDVRAINKMIVECEVCKTQILLVDSAFDQGHI